MVTLLFPEESFAFNIKDSFSNVILLILVDTVTLHLAEMYLPDLLRCFDVIVIVAFPSLEAVIIPFAEILATELLVVL